jgi:uroporphyrinogen decarboxylase
VLERFGVDVIPVFANDPSGPPTVFHDDGRGGTYCFDDFGAKQVKPKDSCYYDWREFPLSEPSLEQLAAMSWPNPDDPARWAGLRERVLRLRRETDYALFGMAPSGHDLFNQLLRVRGMENGLMDLLLNREFVEAFLDRLTETIIRFQTLFLDEVGDLIDVHFSADDLTGQTAPLIPPTVYRELIKPRWAKILAAIKARTKAKILYHGCGAMDQFIPDLIEIGVDILNPVQVSAAGMDTAMLKKKYGKNLAYWGGGCDTQHVLCHDTTDEVRAEVTRRIHDLAPGGGFVFNPVHNIQPHVPPENITAMFETAMIVGQYPLAPAPTTVRS